MRELMMLGPLVLLAAGCAANPPQSPAPPVSDGGTCNAAGLDSYVGQPATQELGSRMFAQSGASTFRWLPKGTIITMEFNGNRLNALLDEQNRVESVRCG